MKLFYGLLLLCILQSSISMDAIIGTREACSNEGEVVRTDKILNSKCYTCMCRNGFVQCNNKEQCPAVEGCHMVLEMPPDSCCTSKCKGCRHEGVDRESGEEWRDPDNPCRHLQCQAGVITETVEQCYTPCDRPQPPAPGTCCPTCPGCKMNGQEVSAGRSVRSLEDPCLKCSCVHGRLSCSKRACPVLHCFPSYVNPPKPGECCPSCQGFRKLYSPPHGQCFLGADIHYPGRSFHPDRCTLCRCENGTSYCHRPSCPVLDCPPEDQTVEPGKCCPFCERRTALSTTCNVGGKIYKEDDTWELDQCQSCSCKEGQVMCVVEMCTQSNIPCPPNHKLVKLPGQCCPKCLESDGVCTVFGDPHYRTFDGKFFSFQGSCKYQLAADCLNNTFSIRVTNDARGTKTSSWTKTVSMKLKDTKINLGDKKRVKINGVRVGVPYDSPVASVTNTDDYVFVETRIGVKLLWDGSSFLELSVPPNYKGRLCGLCGNFNSNPRDDLVTRRGRLATDPDRLGSSWRVGGRRACSRAYETPPPLAPPHCSRYHPRYRERLCKPLRSEIFAVCHKKLNFSLYFRSCLADMCECPSRRCYCESFTAYARECQRLGITLPDWRSATGCHH